MAPIDRRGLFAAGTGLVTALVGTRAAKAANAAADAKLPPAPVARIEATKDTYFGETLSDPYRWMENDKDPDWLPFLKGQDDHTRAALDGITARAALLRRIQQLSEEPVLADQVQASAGRLFYQQRPRAADNYKLYVREDGRDRVLLDPTALGAATGHVSLDWWSASPNGRHIVYGLSRDGSEDSVLQVLRVDNGEILPERIANTQRAHPQWLEDGSGFFYNQLTGAVGAPDRYLDSQARFHRLGGDPAADPIVMKRGLVPGLDYERIQAPYVLTFPGATSAILVIADVRPERQVLIAPLEAAAIGKTTWTPVATFEDEITAVALDASDLYLVTTRSASRGRVLRVSADRPSLSGAVQIAPEGPMVIEDIALAKDGLYLKMMDGGLSRLARLGADGERREIALPFDASIRGVFAAPTHKGVLLTLTGWLTPADVWSVSEQGTLARLGLTPTPSLETGAFETVRQFAEAKDGARIPYSLIFKRGLVRDSRNPAWISAYGSYGICVYTPGFDPRTFALIEAGFIVGYANVRGGGEYGRAWHKAGQLENKPNTWRDLIAVCERLCSEGFTAPERLAIGGRSAGGITVGRAMTERPELFAAVVDGVGWSNPLRYVVEQNGYVEEPEWGAISDQAGYRALRNIDSYQALKDGTPYPAVLLTTGVTDPRVAPFHAGKMTARLQAATSSGKPVLLRVDYDAGHGFGSTRAQQDREAADTYAFLMWQTGRLGRPRP